MTQTEINTWAERAARAAHDSGNQDIQPLDALDFVTNAAYENNEVVPSFNEDELLQFRHDYMQHLSVLAQLPHSWEIRRREECLDGDGQIEAWATKKFYVLDSRTDVRGEGDTIDEAIQDAGLKARTQ